MSFSQKQLASKCAQVKIAISRRREITRDLTAFVYLSEDPACAAVVHKAIQFGTKATFSCSLCPSLNKKFHQLTRQIEWYRGNGGDRRNRLSTGDCSDDAVACVHGTRLVVAATNLTYWTRRRTFACNYRMLGQNQPICTVTRLELDLIGINPSLERVPGSNECPLDIPHGPDVDFVGENGETIVASNVTVFVDVPGNVSVAKLFCGASPRGVAVGIVRTEWLDSSGKRVSDNKSNHYQEANGTVAILHASSGIYTCVARGDAYETATILRRVRLIVDEPEEATDRITPSVSSGSSSRRTVWAISGVIALILVLAVALCIYLWFRRRKASDESDVGTDDDEFDSRFAVPTWKSSWIRLGFEIGRGFFGVVHEAWAVDGTSSVRKLAVKIPTTGKI